MRVKRYSVGSMAGLISTAAYGAPDAAAVSVNGPRLRTLSPARAAGLPLACAAALTAIGLLDTGHGTDALRWSMAAAAAALAIGSAALFAAATRSRRVLLLELAARKQHYLQACAQGSVLLYWGWYWREVYHSLDLIAAQLIFAYAVDMLINWAQHDRYTLGFAPFPVIFSINLFLWFKPDWFYLQFLMVATGFAAKALIRWQKNGRPAHIFNPSSFPLAVFSLALILTGSSDMTLGHSIATTQFYPPHMYLMLFLIGLPGQFFFGVTSMTLAAVAATYLFGLAYFAATGVYFFYDSYIPIAVFLGMHLLFTDPSTSPASELGRILFGILYGLSTVALYALLTRAGVPAFYDKLLQVPAMNLAIGLIDRTARSGLLRRFDPAAVSPALTRRQRNLAYIGVWTLVFAAMSAADGVGDAHRGQWLPFWQDACAADRAGACSYLANLETGYCENGSGWACNEAGIMQARRRDYAASGDAWQRGCALGFRAACANANAKSVDGALETAPPGVDDLPILVRGSKGPIADRSPAALSAAACRAGWRSACQSG
jgi:hypothetical protein